MYEVSLSPSSPRLYEDGGVCKPCSANCVLCTSAISCDSCGNNKFLAVDRATCKSTCPAGTFEQGASVTGRTCVACLTDCAICAEASKCQTCGNSKHLSIDSTSCPTSCPTGTYGSGAGITGRTCENCISGCSRCTGGSTCDECTAPLLLDQGTCVSSCSDGYVHREGEQPSYEPCLCPISLTLSVDARVQYHLVLKFSRRGPHINICIKHCKWIQPKANAVRS